MLEPAINQLVAELGESPEAWRGAMILHDLLRHAVSEMVNVTDDDTEPKLGIVMAGTACMTALIDFGNHPTTKLMVKLLMEAGK